MKKVNVLFIIGTIMIIIGMTIELEILIKDNINKQNIIDSQATEIIRCYAENNNN